MLEEHHKDGAKECEEKMNKEESKRKPPEPVMERGQRDLPFGKDVVVVLLYPCGDDEKEEEKSTHHTCPPHEAVPEIYCHLSHIFGSVTYKGLHKQGYGAIIKLERRYPMEKISALFWAIVGGIVALFSFEEMQEEERLRKRNNEILRDAHFMRPQKPV